MWFEEIINFDNDSLLWGHYDKDGSNGDANCSWSMDNVVRMLSLLWYEW